ncbi:ParA family protein [Metabacillus fastidiosus]|uniref:ParA family protein n=1 Tax=Metabacillus fastidiosus TaxID=1458 RepID=UPI003D2B315D
MTAKVITFGISKGGCSKTTTAGIVAYLLSQSHKVLVVDMDSQGNISSLLTGVLDICNVFEEKTILEALLQKDVRPYIISVTDSLHVIPSNDYLAQLSVHLRNGKYEGNPYLALKEALSHVMDEYDFIILDTPPALGDQTINAIACSDYAVILFDGSQFCYYAIQKFIEICEASRNNLGSTVEVAGILFSIVDPRTSDTKAMIEIIDEEYPDLRFVNLIKRKTATKRLAIYGFQDNKELKEAIEYYHPVVKELLERVQS